MSITAPLRAVALRAHRQPALHRAGLWLKAKPIFFLVVNTGQAAEIFPSESLGRLVAEAAKGILLSSLIVVLALPFGTSVASGPPGFVILVVLSALWGVVYAGFMQLIALKTRSAAATNSGGLIFFPLLFLTPNLVPRDRLTEPMEVAATLNPVTYLMEALRSLILDDLAWGEVLPGFGVVAVLGAIMLVLNVRMIQGYD